MGDTLCISGGRPYLYFNLGPEMNNQEILEKLNKLVYGHVETKKLLITLIQRSKLRYYKKCVLNEPTDLKPLRCLLIGDSGTGKTHLLGSLRTLMPFPYLYIDATRLAPTSADGITQEKLTALIDSTAERAVKSGVAFSHEGALNSMVIFVDEIDKLGIDSNGRGWNLSTQSSFLTLIDNKEKYSGISWVFAGAFHDCKQRQHSRSIGFFTSELLPLVGNIDLTTSGLIPELLGRMSLTARLDTFSAEDYKKILVDFLLPTKHACLTELNINISTPDDTELDRMASQAVSSSQGVRYIEKELETYYLEAEFTNKTTLCF